MTKEDKMIYPLLDRYNLKKKKKEYAHRKQGQYKKYGNKMSMKKNHLVIMNV